MDAAYDVNSSRKAVQLQLAGVNTGGGDDPGADENAVPDVAMPDAAGAHAGAGAPAVSSSAATAPPSGPGYRVRQLRRPLDDPRADTCGEADSVEPYRPVFS